MARIVSIFILSLIAYASASYSASALRENPSCQMVWVQDEKGKWVLVCQKGLLGVTSNSTTTTPNARPLTRD